MQSNLEMIKQGAEARLYKGTYLGKNVIVKERFKKLYRHPELDNRLTKHRIKAESRAIVKCKAAGIHTPAIYQVDLERRAIIMEYVENSVTVKDFIARAFEEDEIGRGDERAGRKRLELLMTEIGTALGRMHKNDIIHGDLTTSNMLVVGSTGPLYLIDFGLSHIQCSIEDKAVDLYVLERAMLSTHATASELFSQIISAYRDSYSENSKAVLVKLDDVRARGRKRTMVG